MLSISQKNFFLDQPKGFGALLFTQLFSTMSFAVLYATLVLYMKYHLQMSSQQADLITGVYFACNFALHLLSGYLGGRLFSYRGLVVIGIIFQLVGCLVLSVATRTTLYWGLACMLVGTGTMVTCLNMLLSQLYSAVDVEKRQSGFLWNYSSMNLGFLFGFTLAGYFQIHIDYFMLFMITAANNCIALLVLASQWKAMTDRDTRFAQVNRSERLKRMLLGLLIIAALLPFLTFLLHHTYFSDHLVLLIGALVALFLVMLGVHSNQQARHKIFAFLILLLCAQMFWIIYQLAPMGLILFARNNVDRHVLGFLIAPGWIQNINSLTIIIGAPLLSIIFSRIYRKRKNGALLPLQYVLGLLMSGLGLLILPIGMMFGHDGYTAFIWIFFTYLFEAIAELLISPIGYSMVGQLISPRWQSICMGSVLLNSGVAAVLASYLSNYALGAAHSSNPLITNASYSDMFCQLGLASVGMSIVLLLITPMIKKLVFTSNSCE